MYLDDKADVDGEYTPEQLARFRRMARDLDESSAAFGRWCDNGRIGPEPPVPHYALEQILEVREWLHRRMNEEIQRYEQGQDRKRRDGVLGPDEDT